MLCKYQNWKVRKTCEFSTWLPNVWTTGLEKAHRESPLVLPCSPQGEIFENVHEFATQEMLTHLWMTLSSNHITPMKSHSPLGAVLQIPVIALAKSMLNNGWCNWHILDVLSFSTGSGLGSQNNYIVAWMYSNSEWHIKQYCAAWPQQWAV